MDSEWFFPWHALGYGKQVDVDRFDGQRIRAGGIRFEAGTSVEMVYWDAVARYVQNKIDEVFGRAEAEIRLAEATHVTELADDAAIALQAFLQKILQHAIDTDRRLKGHGFPDPKYVAPSSRKVSFASEIQSRKAALIAFYQTAAPPTKLSWGQKLEKFVERNKGRIQLISVIAGGCTIIGFLARVFGIF